MAFISIPISDQSLKRYPEHPVSGITPSQENPDPFVVVMQSLAVEDSWQLIQWLPRDERIALLGPFAN